MVHDLLLDYSPIDRDKILSRLRRVQRRQEIKSPQGPNLRPLFVPLYDEDQVENMLGIPHLEQAKSDLPAFVSIPRIDLAKLRRLRFSENTYHVKSLLQYHYKFGIHNDSIQKPDLGLASILDGVRSPWVEEVWCLAFDSKNLITVSWLEADSIWPTLSPGTQYSEPWTEVPRIAISEYFQNNRNLPQERYADLASSKKGLVVVDLMVFFGIVGQILSAVVPGGWMLDQLFRKVEKYVFGIDSSDIIRIGSFFEVLSRSIKIEVERTTWGQADASEEVAQADITDTFAGRITRLEWLVRDSVSQSQVYQISAISDELQILKEILHSQMQVVSQTAQSLAKATASSTSAKAGKGKEPESTETHTSPGIRKEDSGREPVTQIFNSLQKKSQLRHRKLAYDIEKLQDTTERLKFQAALFIKIKAEDQSVTIYVFTFVTVVFLPLSFATSYMGMNTSDIRDMKQGQWIFWAVGGVLTVLVLLSVWTIVYKAPRWKKARQTQKLLHMD
ncbi:Mg2+ transporter protein CorA-like/zinc transport protein ZntB [Fusarium bulbicola]|nr:Mg2+ transporter protein CorA-like/zinc transport protein ZntB [Fusarium bulbicola]